MPYSFTGLENTNKVAKNKIQPPTFNTKRRAKHANSIVVLLTEQRPTLKAMISIRILRDCKYSYVTETEKHVAKVKLYL